MWIVSWPCSIPELVGKFGLQFCDQQCESEQMGWATVACGEKPGKRATDLSFFPLTVARSERFGRVASCKKKNLKTK